jgi:hypothetical protein
MDAAGKDGAIRHVMSGVNPQGCQVFTRDPGPEFLEVCAREVAYQIGRSRAGAERESVERTVALMRAWAVERPLH